MTKRVTREAVGGVPLQVVGTVGAATTVSGEKRGRIQRATLVPASPLTGWRVLRDQRPTLLPYDSRSSVFPGDRTTRKHRLPIEVSTDSTASSASAE